MSKSLTITKPEARALAAAINEAIDEKVELIAWALDNGRDGYSYDRARARDAKRDLPLLVGFLEKLGV